MSLMEKLKAIDPDRFEQVATEQAGVLDYSDEALSVQCAARRRKYPVYDRICKKIENDGAPLLEETLLHAVGMEHMLRALIVIAEEDERR